MELGDISPLDGISVLIVEDELVFRRQLSAFLSKLGASVTEAEDGLSGLALFHSQRFDVILLDVVMPNLSGVGFLERLSTPAPPVIVISGKSNLNDLRKVMTLGASDFLVKPISDFNELANTILGTVADQDETNAQLELAELSEHKNALRTSDTEATRVFNGLLPEDSGLLGGYFYHYQMTGQSLFPLFAQLGEGKMAMVIFDTSMLAEDAVIAAVIANGFFLDLWDRHSNNLDTRAVSPSEALDGLNKILCGAELKAPLCCFYGLFEESNLSYANAGVIDLTAPLERECGVPLGMQTKALWHTYTVERPISSLNVSKINLLEDRLRVKLLHAS